MTALVEEVTFRAVLFGLWRRVVPLGGEGWRRVLRWLAPSLATGAAFGLWHIGPTRDTLLELHLTDMGALPRSGGRDDGCRRCGLRIASAMTSGIAGGILLHAMANGSVVAAGFVNSQGLITH